VNTEVSAEQQAKLAAEQEAGAGTENTPEANAPAADENKES